jgi:hypothetical protein
MAHCSTNKQAGVIGVVIVGLILTFTAEPTGAVDCYDGVYGKLTTTSGCSYCTNVTWTDGGQHYTIYSCITDTNCMNGTVSYNNRNASQLCCQTEKCNSSGALTRFVGHLPVAVGTSLVCWLTILWTIERVSV